MPFRGLQKQAPRFKVTCDVCGLEEWNTTPGLAAEVKGWVVNRGAAGGVNHVRQQKKTGRYRHVACLDEDAKDPITKAQETLFT